MSVTILDIALTKGAREVDGSISMGEFAHLDLPFFSGCQCCGAQLGPHNAYPSRTGYIRCRECVGDLGFAAVADFDEFVQQEETRDDQGTE